MIGIFTILILATTGGINISIHDDYGVSYPITYIFDIPPGSSLFHAYHKHQSGDSWVELTQKTSDDFFNGIEAVRFDYTNSKAYVSVSFDPSYNTTFLMITDNAGVSKAQFNSIAKYYDNRVAAVTVSGDDWQSDTENNEAFKKYCDMMTSKLIWASVGLSHTNHQIYWSDVQSKIDAGYIEPLAHGRDHIYTPYPDNDIEIGQCLADIKANVSFPALDKAGSTEYIWAWIEPYGMSDDAVRIHLAEYKYLVSRDTNDNENDFAAWNAGENLFARVGVSIRMGDDGTTNVTTLNAKFDSVYAAGGIYHLMCHPYLVDWTADQYADVHTDYIAGKKDVWYCGFGQLYLYRYAATQAAKVML